MEKTRKFNVTAYPYAVQYGTIEVPVDIEDDEVDEYIMEHWEEIEFGDVELDYAGTDVDVEED